MVIVPKIAAVERRKARVPSQGCAGAFAQVPQLYLRRSGALPPSGEAKKTRAKTFFGRKRPGRQGQDDLTIRANSSRGEENACVRFNRDHQRRHESFRFDLATDDCRFCAILYEPEATRRRRDKRRRSAQGTEEA